MNVLWSCFKHKNIPWLFLYTVCTLYSSSQIVVEMTVIFYFIVKSKKTISYALMSFYVYNILWFTQIWLLQKIPPNWLWKSYTLGELYEDSVLACQEWPCTVRKVLACRWLITLLQSSMWRKVLSNHGKWLKIPSQRAK